MDTKGESAVAASNPVYGTAIAEELSTEELEAARLGFRQMLRRKRFSAHFIEAHGEELLARARFEYSRAVRRGDQIRKPAGWIIHCAWRRTQNQLESESHEPALVSTEKAPDVVDSASATPEQVVIDADRARAIEVAMEQLSGDQRTLIELSYFEGLSVREAGRALGWHSSKAQRTHESALRKLREALGVTDIDELAIEIGLAAWVSLSASKQVLPALPGGIEAAADAGQRSAQSAWSRAQELARRVLLGGGEPSGAMAAGGAARTAGVCGAAAVACLAGGVVGPGVGGVGLVAGGVQQRQPVPVERQAEPVAPEASAEYVASEEVAEAPVQASGKFGKPGSEEDKPEVPSEATSEAPASPEGQAEAEFSPFEGAASPSPQPSSAPPPAPAASVRSSAAGSSGGPSSASTSSGAEGEFGAFK